MRRLPPLKPLKVFESAARNQSFTFAAQELFITASAVSHQIKALEQHLGVALFTRQKRSVELTANGEIYFTSVKHLFNELEVATQRIIESPETDTITISVAPNFLVRWLMPRMKKFQQQYPEIELQISASMGLIDFNKSSVDMAIYYGQDNWPDVDSALLTHVYLVPVCSPKLIDSTHPLKELSDLKHHTLIHVVKRLYEWPDWFNQANIKPIDFKSRGLHLSSSQLTTAAAQEGLGIALGDSILSSEEIAQGKLIIPFNIQLDTHKSFYLVNQKGKPMTQAMQAFKHWIIDEMQQNKI